MHVPMYREAEAFQTEIEKAEQNRWKKERRDVDDDNGMETI